MKFWESGPFGTKTLTPQGQLWGGLLISASSAIFGYISIFHPRTAADRPMGIVGYPCGVIGGLWLAWIGYRSRRKD
jgi:hypothetical protein